MIDVKKLITGFLILAVAAVASGLILSFAGNSISNAVVPPSVAINNVGTAPANTNAFLPEEPTQNVSDSPSSTLIVATATDPNNLTEAVANSFINQVAAANPSGAMDDGTGNKVLNNPNVQVIAANAINSSTIQNFVAPDWDYEAGSQPIKIAASSSVAVANYSQALNDITTKHFVSTNVENILSSANSDASQANFIATNVQGALSDAINLPTPKPLLAFQKSFVKILIYQKNELKLVQDANTDPAKAALILQSEEDKYNQALTDLETEAQKASSLNGFSFGGGPLQSQNRAMAFVDSLLGIKSANAQWLTFDAAAFGHLILTYVNNIILQILKNTLIAIIQQHVLTWVQGSGLPRFITDWGTTLINSYQQTALNALNSQMTCGVNVAFIPLLRTTLGAFYTPATNNICADQFQAALGANTFQQFTDNFRNGGFIAFGATALPSGNPYGGAFFQAQIIDYTAQNALNATQAKSIASNGYTAGRDLTCADGSDPNGTYTACKQISTGNLSLPSGGSCGPGFVTVNLANNGKCSNGLDPTENSPAALTGSVFGSAVDASPKLVTAANDIAGVLNTLLTSLLNSLATQAVAAGSAGVNGLLTSSISGGGIAPVANIPLSCSPNTQNVSSSIAANLGAFGGTNNINGNPPIYNWLSSNGVTSTGYIFSPIYTVIGTYTITLSDSTGDPSVTCQINVQ